MQDIDLVLCHEQDGSPVLDDSGNPIMWVDVLAEVARQAIEEGFQLEIAENENGEVMFRLVEVGESIASAKDGSCASNQN